MTISCRYYLACTFFLHGFLSAKTTITTRSSNQMFKIKNRKKYKCMLFATKQALTARSTREKQRPSQLVTESIQRQPTKQTTDDGKKFREKRKETKIPIRSNNNNSNNNISRKTYVNTAGYSQYFFHLSFGFRLVLLLFMPGTPCDKI